jgi:heptosyltransferase-2|tara:strand:- start:21436 stop:22479 length:1044 start_codon:yes stop_codon:yes gene_type:complete
MNRSQQEKFLIIGPSWVGDMVMAQVLFIRLKQNHPDCEITVIAPAWAIAVLKRMPEVNNIQNLSLGHGELGLLQRRKIGRSLEDQGFTTAIVLPNSFKSALIPYHAGIPVRIGWRGEWRVPLLTDCRKLDKEKFPLMVQRFAALAEPESEQPLLDLKSPEFHVDDAERSLSLKKYSLDLDKPIIAICPGAEFGDAKQWPAEHFAEFCNMKLSSGAQIWLFGSSNDSEISDKIAAGINEGYSRSFKNLSGLTNLAEAIDLLSFAGVCVSNDSGLMHVAAALKVPVIAIYGSTSAEFTPPLSEKVELLTTDIECRPCFQRKCPLGHLRCLKDIQPVRVSQSVNRLLDLT